MTSSNFCGGQRGLNPGMTGTDDDVTASSPWASITGRSPCSISRKASSQLTSSILLFRFLAGVLLGVLYSWRGLAVVAYAHAFYNALILI